MKLLSSPKTVGDIVQDVCIVCERPACPSRIFYTGPLSGAEPYCRNTAGWLNVGPKLVCSKFCAAVVQGLPVET